MARFIIRSLISAVITMLLVSAALFFFIEVGSGDVTVKILGIESTPEQRASYRAQLGLDAPAWQRYLDWLAGSDWRAESAVGMPLVTVRNESTNEAEWWANDDGQLKRWDMVDGQMVARIRQPDGTSVQEQADVNWSVADDGTEYFWGVDRDNNAVMWVRGSGETVWVRTKAGFRK